MAEPKIEGTLRVEGLLEGSPASLSEHTEDLQDWAQRARSLGFPFSLSIEGSSFNVLAEPRPIVIRELDAQASGPAEAVAAALNSLLEIFPPDQRRTLLSTIHSTEYRRNLEVQTLYAIGPDATIHTREQIVETQTVAPAEPLTRSQKIRLGIISGAVLLVLLGGAGLLLWHFGVLGRVAESVTPLDAEHVQVELGGFDTYFTPEKIGKRNTGRQRFLLVTIRRGPDWPADAAAAEALLSRDDTPPLERLRAEAVVRGYARIELYRGEELLGWSHVRLAGLDKGETTELAIPLPGDRNPDRIVFRP